MLGLLQEHARGLYAGLVELDLANGLPAVLLELVQFLGVLKVQALSLPALLVKCEPVVVLLKEQSQGFPAGLVDGT